MATILRSTKFVRYFAGVARNIVFNSTRETDGSFVPKSQCLCSSFTHNYGTSAPKPDQGLDQSIKRLDQDVRRVGRISRRDLEEVLEEIRQQRTATSSQSLLVIRCCGNLVPEELPEVRTALVQDIWRTLNNLNVPMDISHYNALLRVYLENEHVFSPTDFLVELEAKGLEPNRVTYQRLIQRYCQDGDIDGATRILEFMREKQHPVNEYVFNALILGHSQANDMESAEGILGVMKQAGLEPTAETYTTLNCGFAKSGNIEAILKSMATCEEKEIYLLDKDVLEVAYALAINGHGAKVDVLLEKTRKSVGYNQDAFNLILRLTNKGQVDVAFKVLESMVRSTNADGNLNDTGNFFVRQMVKANLPFEKILGICRTMKEKEMNPRAVLIAIEAALQTGATDLVIELLREAHKTGLEVRQHYFWPVLVSTGKSGSVEAVTAVLKQMNEFGLAPSGETVRDYVVPNLKEERPDQLMNILIGAGVSSGQAASSVCFNLLQKNKLKEAAIVGGQYKLFLAPSLFRKLLVTALANTKDVDNFIKFVRVIHDSQERKGTWVKLEQVEEDAAVVDVENSGSVQKSEIIGQIVNDIVGHFRTNRVEMLEKVLVALVAEGLSMSGKQAELVQERLGAQMTTEISDLLSKLTAGDLEPVHREPEKRGSPLSQMSPSQIEKLIEQVQAKGENVNRLKRYWVASCFRDKDLKKAEEVIEKLEKEGYVVAGGVFAQLIDLYVQNNELEKALKTLERVRAKDGEFKLDNLKIIRLASLMVDTDKLADAIKFLEENRRTELALEEQSFNYNAVCWRLLNGLAEKGKATELNSLFDTLVAGNYVEANNVLLGPLIKVHLLKDDIPQAMDTFEKISNKYRSTPWKNELSCRLIQSEDAANLQRLTDLSTNVHGEVNSLYDLVFSFVECGQIRQARKILETPGLKVKHQRINHACERYREEGKQMPLEGLIEATRDLNHIDRQDIYYNLLLSYKKENQPEKALGLWTKMQEDDMAPTEEFLNTLADLLRANKMPVPFASEKRPVKKEEVKTAKPIEEKKAQPKKVAAKEAAKAAAAASVVESGSGFRAMVRKGDVDEAKKLYAKEKDNKWNITDLSKYMELLVKENQLSEANNVVKGMLDQNKYPLLNNFRFYLNKLAANGDVDTIQAIGDKLSTNLKKQLSFDNRLCHAYIAGGKVEQYLTGLETELDAAKTDEDLQRVGEKFPRGGAVGILETHPELAGRFEEVAEKYAKRGVLAPMNVMWMHHFVLNNVETSEKIWNTYIKESPRLMFQRVMHEAREKQDAEMMVRLIETLRTTQLTKGAMGNAYSCLIDVHSSKEQFEEAYQVLVKAVKEVDGVERINRTALLRVKEGLEKTKSPQKFEFEIPRKSQKEDSSSSSSSSSSDDEPIKK